MLNRKTSLNADSKNKSQCWFEKPKSQCWVEKQVSMLIRKTNLNADSKSLSLNADSKTSLNADSKSRSLNADSKSRSLNADSKSRSLNADSGSIPRWGKGLFSLCQLLMQIPLRCSYSPCLYSYASTYARTLKITNTGSYTIVRTHENTAHTGRNG